MGLEAEKFDLVVLDLRIGDDSGLDVLASFEPMGTIVIGFIAALLLIYLFATMIYPEKF